MKCIEYHSALINTNEHCVVRIARRVLGLITWLTSRSDCAALVITITMFISSIKASFSFIYTVESRFTKPECWNIISLMGTNRYLVFLKTALEYIVTTLTLF